ncbi:hypothetical protein EUBC25_01550 [Claveliimonas bilis]|uniref:GNAT family N-acetyltransferase n=1 Tax=Claveliimonas bilis TaxID=3028070 RepID=UPI001E5FA7B4|nr:GNAT family N-acetyltransferase [Claveliimonas bilis]BCZ26068.1 hypothetical protein EUBC25_01550 [Claveliimonas bilis]
MVWLREALQSDIDLLYEWTNDPIVRQNSFHSEMISYAVHKEWFARIMEDKNIVQYILIADEEPVGQIRLTIDGNKAEIGYSIAPQHRQRGYGRMILQLIVDEVKHKFPDVKEVVAKVKPENIASKKLFESEGYDMKYLCYVLDTNKKLQDK